MRCVEKARSRDVGGLVVPRPVRSCWRTGLKGWAREACWIPMCGSDGWLGLRRDGRDEWPAGADRNVAAQDESASRQVCKGHVCSFLSLWLGAGSACGPCASSPVAGAGLLCSGRRQVPSAHPRITIVAIPTQDTDPPDCVQSAQLAAMLPTRYGRCIARRLLDVVPLPSPLLWPGPRAKARQVPLNEC